MDKKKSDISVDVKVRQLLQIDVSSEKSIDDDMIEKLYDNPSVNENLVSLVGNFNLEKDKYSDEVKTKVSNYITTYLYLYMTKQLRKHYDLEPQQLILNYSREYKELLQFIINNFKDGMIYDIFKILIELMKESRSYEDTEIHSILKFSQDLLKPKYVKEALISSNFWKKKDAIENERDTFLGQILTISECSGYNHVNHKTYMVIVNKILRSFLKNKSTKENLIQWFLTVIKQNEYRTKIVNQLSHRKDNSNNFIMNILGQLLSFWNNGSKNLTFIQNIDFKYVTSDELGWKSATKITTICDDDGVSDGSGAGRSSGDEIDDIEIDNTSFLTKCFFMVHRMAHIAYFPLILKYKNYTKTINYLKDFIKDELEKEHNIYKQFLISKMTTKLESFMLKRENIHKLLSNSLIYPSINKLYSDTSMLIIHYINTENFKTYSLIPEYMLENCIDVHLYQSYNLKMRNYKIEKTIHMIMYMLEDKKYISNPHLRGKCIELLINSREIGEYSLGFLQEHPNVIVKLLLLYKESEELPDQRIIQNDILFYLILVLKSNSVCSDLIEMLSEKHKDMFVKFIYSMVSNMNSIFDTICNLLEEIQKARNDLIEHPNNIESLNNARLISHNKEAIRFHNQLFKRCLTIFELFSLKEKTKNILLYPENISKIALTLNYYIKSLMKPYEADSEYSFNINIEPTLFNRDPILKQLLKVILILEKEEDFIEAMVQENTFYNNTFYRETLNLLSYKKMISWNLMGKVFVFLDKVNSKKEDLLDDGLPDDIEVPDEFCCEIMKVPLKNPVQLPVSKQIVEKSYILNHLLSNEINPYTRTELTKDMLEEYNSKEEVKATIRELMDNFRDWKESILKSD